MRGSKLLVVCSLIILVFPTILYAETSAKDGIAYHLLIVAPHEFCKALEPLVEHKTKHGIKTKLVSIEEVYDQMFWYGRDKAEKLKYFIKFAKDIWGIKYVLLVGDYRKIPIRYVYNSNNYPDFPEPKFVSELYYADIYDENGSFSSWDTDNDGIYGEWIGDEAEDKNIDLYPDVCVGRLACRNVREVRIMVDKIIKYETRTYNTEWFKRFVVVAGDTYPECLNPRWVGNEGEINTMKAIQNMSEFEVVKLWTSDGSFTGPKDVIRAINWGCGFIFFEGHGSPMTWATHPPNDPGTWVKGLSIYNMWRLHNFYKLPICLVSGCHNSQIDVTPLNLLIHPRESLFLRLDYPIECWSWKLVSLPFGGAIAAVGNTGLGMTKEDKESFEGASDYLDARFFWEYGKNGTDILGEVWAKAITAYLNEYPIDWNTPAGADSSIDAKVVQEWILLGDPSLKIGGYPN